MAIQLVLNANSGYGVPVKIFTRDVVMANQTDLVEVVHILRQVMCIKG